VTAALRVGLVFGGRSVEHRVSVRSARTVARGLAAAGHTVVAFGLAQDGGWADAATSQAALAGEIDAIAALGQPVAATLGRLAAASADGPVDAFFPIVHGTWGEDGSLQGLFEMLDVPYAGAGVTASALAMDKALTKRQLAAAGIPVVEGVAITAQRFAAEREACLAAAAALPAPWFVKPSVGGSSVGVCKVREAGALAAAIEQALRFDGTVLVERAVDGRELECAVLGYQQLEASVVGEIVAGREFYDYEDKYLTDGARLIAPAPLDEALAQRLRALAVAAFAAVGGSGMARVDFLLERQPRPQTPENPGAADPGLYVNEINTLPGFTDISMYPRLWALSGVELPALVDRLVRIGIERHRDRQALDRGIADWLDELGRR
jgi:D-alanine-D-alanine ligase